MDGRTLSRAGEQIRQKAAGPVLNVVYLGDDCQGGELAPQCRKNPNGKAGRKLTRDEHEAARERHRERLNQPEPT